MTRHFLVFSLSLAFVPSAELPSVAQAPAPSSGLDAIRKYVLTHEGDVARGARLFADEQKLACSKCHSVDGRATKAGPDLFAVGDKFGRRDLVDAVLMPSAVISPGYGTVIVETKAGVEYQGVLKQATDAGMQLMGADGKLVSVAIGDIQEQRGSAVSLMPEELQAGLSLMDFSRPTRIGDRIERLKPKMNGYDHNYILGEGKAMKMAARLVEPKSGRIMEVRTTQPAVQL